MNRESKNITIALLLICILTMAVGYSILQQRLNVEGTANVSSVWDVQVTGIREIGTEGLAETENLNFTPTSATFSTNLQAPGDYAYYEIEVENKGTLNAYSILDANSISSDLEDLISILVVGGSKEQIPYESYNQFMGQMEKFMFQNTKLATTLASGEKTYYYALVQYHDSETKLPTEKTLEHIVNFTFEQAINFPMSKTLDVTLYGTLPNGITVEPTATLTNSSDYTSQQLTITLKRDTSVNTTTYSGCQAKITYQLTDGNEETNGTQSWISAWWTEEELDIFTDPTKTEQTYNFNLNISPDLNEAKTLYIYNGCL